MTRLICILAMVLPTFTAQAQQEDWGGLPPGEGRETVFYMCTACHDAGLIAQQGMSRARWQETLDWMVEKQGMPPLPPAEETAILDYLARNIGEDRGLSKTLESRPPTGAPIDPLFTAGGGAP